MDISIRKLGKNDKIPYDLLILADPSRDLLEKYVKEGNCYIAENNNHEVIGTYLLTFPESEVVEIKEIAINPKYQGMGYGKYLIKDAIARTKETNAKKMIIGTGNSSLTQLALYQKCGFRLEKIEKDFFVKNYSDPIFENGIQCTDMVILSQDL